MTFRTFSISQSFLLDVGSCGEANASQKEEVSFDIKDWDTREAITACWGVCVGWDGVFFDEPEEDGMGESVSVRELGEEK